MMDILKKHYLLDLQHFADGGSGEKTEKATPKKRQDARKEGNVFQSKEMTSAITLLTGVSLVFMWGETIYKNIGSYTENMFRNSLKPSTLNDVSSLNQIMIEAVFTIIVNMLPILGIIMITGLFMGYMQVGFLVIPIKFKFGKLNPINGFKNLFSFKSIFEMFKSIAKIAIIIWVVYSYLKNEVSNLHMLYVYDLNQSVTYMMDTAFNIAMRVCIALIIISILDFAFQKYQYEKNLKMTKQEIKEEYKQMEGDPQIKSRIKQKQREIAMQRMMQDVPEADVVITNPTHFAIAVKYDSGKHKAPYVLAKGQDFMAQKIKQIAGDSDVPIVENKPLARLLFKQVEIGDEIPQDLYQAVAEVLAYVYNLKKTRM
jgi:flagellar biosynthetic protein FlhB